MEKQHKPPPGMTLILFLFYFTQWLNASTKCVICRKKAEISNDNSTVAPRVFIKRRKRVYIKLSLNREQ